MNHSVSWPICQLIFVLSVFPLSSSFAQVVIPDLGDINCDGVSNVVDVQLALRPLWAFR